MPFKLLVNGIQLVLFTSAFINNFIKYDYTLVVVMVGGGGTFIYYEKEHMLKMELLHKS